MVSSAVNNRSSGKLSLVIFSTASAILFRYLFILREKKKDYNSQENNKTSSGASQEDENIDIIQYLPPHLLREKEKEKRRQAKIENYSMKSKMYDNISMLSPADKLLCKVSLRKARWYITRELAEWNEEGEGSIKLLFEPRKGSGSKESTATTYTISDKKNICVLCGNEKHHTRYYIVPYCYRSHLPQRFKSHMSHDIVVVCANCRVHCEQLTQKRMKEIELTYRSKGDYKSQFEHDPMLYKVRSSALALMHWKHKIPENKLKYHENIVCKYLSTIGSIDMKQTFSMVTPTLLQKAVDVDFRVENPKFIPGAELVVQMLKGDEEKIENFVLEWRKFFIENFKPNFLPQGWKIDNPVASDSRISTSDC